MSNFNTLDLLKRNEKGSKLTHSEMDGNLTKIEQVLNELVGSLNLLIDDTGQFVLNSVSGAGLKDATIPTSKMSEMFVGTDVGTVNTLTIKINKTITALNDNMLFVVKVGTANTGPTRVVVQNTDGDQIGAGDLLKEGNKALEAGDLGVGSVVLFKFSSPSFSLINTLGNADPEINVVSSYYRVYGPVTINLNDGAFDADDTPLTYNHGLGGTPIIEASLKCLTDEHGYVAGDEIPYSSAFAQDGSANQQHAFSIKVSPTAISVFRHSDTVYIPDFAIDGDTRNALDDTKWALVITARYQYAGTVSQYGQSLSDINLGSAAGVGKNQNDILISAKAREYTSVSSVLGGRHTLTVSAADYAIYKYNPSTNNISLLHYVPAPTSSSEILPGYYSLVKWSHTNCIATTTDKGLTYYDLATGQLKTSTVNNMNTAVGNYARQPFEFSGTATITADSLTVPNTFYSIGYNLYAYLTSAIAFEVRKWAFNVTTQKYDPSGAIVTINLNDSNKDYTGRTTFSQFFNNVSVAASGQHPLVHGFSHNPVKKRIYLSLSDGFVHIFKYTTDNWDDFFAAMGAGTWNSNFEYEKTILKSGDPDALFVEYDFTSGDEQSVITKTGRVDPFIE